MDPLRPDDPTRIDGFRLIARLADGRAGPIYLARSPIDRPIALTLVRPEIVADTEFRARFAREFPAARQVAGPFATPALDAYFDESPAWLAATFVPGVTLAEAVTRHGPLPPETFGALAAGLAGAIQAVHFVGLIHGDVSPSSVLLSADGPRLADVGAARAAAERVSTPGGAMLGTPGFLSPEQVRGEVAGPASDVFSWAAVLVYAATGTGPFGAGRPGEVVARTTRLEPETTGVPAPLRDLVTVCLARDPAARPQSRRLLAELAAVGFAPERIGHGGAWLPATLAGLVADRFAALPTDLRATDLRATSPAATVGTAGPDPQGAAPTAPAPAPSAPAPTGRRRHRGPLIAAAGVVGVAVLVGALVAVARFGNGDPAQAVADCGAINADFAGGALDPALRRQNDAAGTFRPGDDGLQVLAPSGADARVDFQGRITAPFLSTRVRGDVTIQTQLSVDPRIGYQAGGLLLYAGPADYVRLERGYGNFDAIAWEYRQGGVHVKITGPFDGEPVQGRAPETSDTVGLRMVRTGDRVAASWRADDGPWQPLPGTAPLPQDADAGITVLNAGPAPRGPFTATFRGLAVGCRG